MLKTLIAAAACAGLLCGCANTGGVPHLSDYRCQRLVTDVDQLEMAGGPLPESIQRLKPVQIYGDHGNVVIALHRDNQGEQGFYIVPTTSSFDPRYKPRPDWTFKLEDPTDPYADNLFEYSRKWKPSAGSN